MVAHGGRTQSSSLPANIGRQLHQRRGRRGHDTIFSEIHGTLVGSAVPTLIQECGSTISYGELTEKAEAAPPFQSIIDPDDLSFMNPADMPTAIKAFCERSGQPVPGDAPSTVRICLEAFALRYRKTKEELESNLGKTIHRIHIVGGGSQNRLTSVN